MGILFLLSGPSSLAQAAVRNSIRLDEKVLYTIRMEGIFGTPGRFSDPHLGKDRDDSPKNLASSDNLSAHFVPVCQYKRDIGLLVWPARDCIRTGTITPVNQ